MYSLSLYDTKSCSESPPGESIVSTSGSATFFDVGIFGPIIFGINFFITAFKLLSQAKFIGKGVVEELKQKTACLQFMVIPCLTLFSKVIVLESRDVISFNKMLINTLIVHFFIMV